MPETRKALVKNGVVENVIMADDAYSLTGYTIVTASNADIGDLYDGSVFSKPMPVMTVAQHKDSKKIELGGVRWQKEIGGIIYAGSNIATDRDSQNKLSAARILAKENATYTVSWKTNLGWIDLDAPTVILIADSVVDYISKCYAQEKVHDLAISALSVKQEIYDYDVSVGWTTNIYI